MPHKNSHNFFVNRDTDPIFRKNDLKISDYNSVKQICAS